MARIIIAVMLMLSGLSGTALADPRDGSAEANDYMRQYARCMLFPYHREAVDLVTSMIDEEDFARRFPQLVLRDAVIQVPICQPPLFIRSGLKVNFDGNRLRFALAESLVEREWRGAEPVSFADVPALPRLDVEPRAQFDARFASVSGNAQRTRVRARYDRSVAMAWLARYGECVARRAPAASRAWVIAAPNSRNDASTISALMPAFGECLAADETLTFDKDTLRGMVAVSYVRLARFLPSLHHKAAQ